MKRKRWKQLFAGTLAFGMVLSTAAGGRKAVPVQAQEPSGETSEWEELSAILDSYPGVYTKDTKLGLSWDTNCSPDGPFMGNGTVYAFMAGDRKTQNIYISRSDMWENGDGVPDQDAKYGYTTYGGITIQSYNGENLALNKEVTVCAQTKETEGGAYMVDGNTNTKWCATQNNNGGSTIYWAVVDLEESCEISRWVVKHAQAGGEGASLNTKDFKLQYYKGEGVPNGAVDSDWEDADTVTGNAAAVTDRNLTEAIQTRYVRLLVTAAEQNATTVRIPEFELYQKPKPQKDEPAEFRYEQDMKNAEIQAVSEDNFKTRSWLSAKENLIVSEITNLASEPVSMSVGVWTVNRNISSRVEGDVMLAEKSAVGTNPVWSVNVATAAKVIGVEDVQVTSDNAGKCESVFTLAPNETAILVAAVEGGKNSETYEQDALDKLNSRLSRQSIQEANERHREWWKEYWLKSYINIENEQLERMYYGMLYMLGCAASTSSEHCAGVAPGLFPWTANSFAKWQGAYFTNTDAPRQVHPLIQANRLDGLENYINIMKDFWPEGQRRAASASEMNDVIRNTNHPRFEEGIRGALFPTAIAPWGIPTWRVDYTYQNQPSNASSMLMPMVKLWQYTQDEDYLRNTLYPMLRDLAFFWQDYVVWEDGKYVVYGATHESAPGRNSIFDVDACIYILKNAIVAANELNVDQECVPVWQNIIDNMSPVPTFIYNGKETIKEHEGRTPSRPGNTFGSNPVTIQSVYYFDSIGMSAPEEEKEKYINYLDLTSNVSSHRRLISATRLGYDIEKIMNQLLENTINPSPGAWSGLRGNNTVGDIGASAAIGIIQDSLLQSNEDFINIFANWYEDQEASFRRMRAKGAFLVDADQNEYGQVTYVNIHSEKGKDCSVLNPWSDQEMEVYENGRKIEISSTEENSLGTVYTFQTKVGADYELKPAGGLKGILKLDKETMELRAGSTDILSAFTNVENADIIWTTSDQNVAVVGNDGTILALKEGTAVITASILGEGVSAKCEVTVKDGLVNVAPYGTATASSFAKDFPANRAISGTWNYNYEGWVSENESWDSVNGRWLQIDLGEEYTIERWVLKLDGHRQQKTDDPVGDSNDASNWGDYYLQVSEDGINDWKTLDFKLDNKTNTISQTLDEPVTGRYFRIYMEFPMFKSDAGWEWPSGYARLSQVELYAKPEASEEVKVTEVQKIDSIEVAFGTTFDRLSLPDSVTVKLSNDMSVDFQVSWVKGTYNENQSGEYTLSGTLQPPEGITNPDNLTAAVTVKVNATITAKELLQKTCDYALKLNTDGVTDSAKAYFEKALANAKAVLENPDATQEVIDKAWNDLVDAIHGLGVVKGDLTYLKILIDKADSMMADKDKYVDTNWQKMLDELAEAKEVYNNGDALQEDIDKAVDELLDAILIQRYKANKDNLAELIEKADKMDLFGYTKESVEFFKAALAEAKTVMADESLSVDDQKKVDMAEKELNDAIKALVKASDGGKNNGTTGGKDDGKGDNNSGKDGKTDAPKTGDMFPVMFWIAAMLLAVLGTTSAIVVYRRRAGKR